MKCNRRCYWNFDGECCPEDEEGLDNATGKRNCPTYLHEDFKEYFYNTLKECKELLNHRNIKELEQIKRFILNQRK